MSYRGHPDQHYGHTTYSQHGEDLLLLNLLKLLRVPPGGAFAWLDVGAHHPVDISNTKLLYDFGYRGINVEANPLLAAAFTENRYEDLNLNTGVGAASGRATFYMFDSHSGRNTFAETEAHKVDSRCPRVTGTLSMDVTTLDSVVNAHCEGLYPPLLLIDIEGWDYATLQAANFHSGRPQVICVETRPEETTKMGEMLSTKGFNPLVRMGENMIFVHHSVRDAVGAR